MKRVLSFLLLLFFVSCASLDELIENGQYDLAIKKGIQNLKRKPNDAASKKLVIQALELAQEKDRIAIRGLMEKEESGKNWETIYNAHVKMRTREDKVRSAGLKPSKASAHSVFELSVAQDEVCKWYFDEAVEFIEKDDRLLYQKAFYKLNRLNDFECNDLETDSLERACKSKGRAFVTIQVDEQKNTHIPIDTENRLKNIYANGSNELGKWTTFYSQIDLEKPIHYVIQCRFNQLMVSKNKRESTEVKMQKKILDHYEKRKNAEGKEVNTPIYITVKATLTTVKQSKTSSQGLYLEILDVERASILFKKQVVGKVNYYFEYSTFTGDKRALSDKQKSLIKKTRKGFPTSSTLIKNSGKELVRQVKREIKNIRRLFQ